MVLLVLLPRFSLVAFSLGQGLGKFFPLVVLALVVGVLALVLALSVRRFRFVRAAGVVVFGFLFRRCPRFFPLIFVVSPS